MRLAMNGIKLGLQAVLSHAGHWLDAPYQPIRQAQWINSMPTSESEVYIYFKSDVASMGANVRNA